MESLSVCSAIVVSYEQHFILLRHGLRSVHPPIPLYYSTILLGWKGSCEKSAGGQGAENAFRPLTAGFQAQMNGIAGIL